MFSEPNLTTKKCIIEAAVTASTRSLKIEFDDVELLDLEGFIKKVKVDGSFNQVNFQISIDFADGLFFKQSPKFRDVSLEPPDI